MSVCLFVCFRDLGRLSSDFRRTLSVKNGHGARRELVCNPVRTRSQIIQLVSRAGLVLVNVFCFVLFWLERQHFHSEAPYMSIGELELRKPPKQSRL